jgi:hypothetical protein
MRQIVLDNPPSSSTSLLLEKIRKQAASKYRKVKQAAKKAAKKVRKAATRKRKVAAKKSKPNKGKNMAKSKKSKGKRSKRSKSAKRGTSKKRGSSRRGKRGKKKVVADQKRRKSSNRIIVVGRRLSVRKGSILNMNPFKIKSLISRENLVTAGGVVAASIVTRFVATELAKRKIALPLAAQYPTAANAVYNLAIPVLGAALTRRFSPALARGMIFGGLAASISSLITSFNTSSGTTAATGRYMREYLDPVRSTGAYLAPRAAASMGNMPARAMGAYSGFNAWA